MCEASNYLELSLMYYFEFEWVTDFIQEKNILTLQL